MLSFRQYTCLQNILRPEWLNKNHSILWPDGCYFVYLPKAPQSSIRRSLKRHSHLWWFWKCFIFWLLNGFFFMIQFTTFRNLSGGGLSSSPVFSNTKRGGVSLAFNPHSSPSQQHSPSLSPRDLDLLSTSSHISGPVYLLFIYLTLPHRTWNLDWQRICNAGERKGSRGQKCKSFSRWNLKTLISLFSHCQT